VENVNLVSGGSGSGGPYIRRAVPYDISFPVSGWMSPPMV
jgi:hypothetical protein